MRRVVRGEYALRSENNWLRIEHGDFGESDIGKCVYVYIGFWRFFYNFFLHFPYFFRFHKVDNYETSNYRISRIKKKLSHAGISVFSSSHIFLQGIRSDRSFNRERTIGLLFDPPTIRTIFRIALLPITNSPHSTKCSTSVDPLISAGDARASSPQRNRQFFVWNSTGVSSKMNESYAAVIPTIAGKCGSPL